MFIPKVIPKRPVQAYVMHYAKRGWFKIGISHSPYGRASKVPYEVGARAGDVRVWHRWSAIHFFGALYIEQTVVGIIKDWGFPQVADNDWFAIDEGSMNEIIEMTADVSYEIANWEKYAREPNRCWALRHDKPYGQMYYDKKDQGIELHRRDHYAEPFQRFREREYEEKRQELRAEREQAKTARAG